MKKIISLFNILEKKNQKKSFYVLLFSIFDGIFQLIGVASLAPIIGIINNSKIIEENFILKNLYNIIYHQDDYSNIKNFLLIISFGSLALIISSTIIRFYSNKFSNNFIENIRHELSFKLYQSYLNQSFLFHIKNHSSELLKNVLSEIDKLTTALVRPIIKAITATIIVVFIGGILIFSDPLNTLISTFVLFGVYYILSKKTKNNFLKIGNQNLKFNSLRFKTVTESFTSIKAIKVNQHENYFIKNFTYQSKIFTSGVSKGINLKMLPNIVIEGIIYILLLSIIIFKLTQSTNESIINVFKNFLPLLTLAGLAMIKLKPSIDTVFQGLSSYREGFSILDKIENEFSSEPKTKIEYKDELQFYSLVLKNINFKYPNTNNLVLENINLEILKGDFVGVIGKTGSGKSTLIDIIVGLLKPINGEIILNNNPVALNSNWLKIIGYVPQEPVILDVSIKENITFGEEEFDINRFKKSIAISQLDDIIDIKSLDGCEKKAGESGKNLSGGQKQRIGIARALYKNPQILILDESTSALDKQTQENLLSNILKINNITIIMITHDPVSLKNCNKIIEIEKKI